jgi:hypothetical protein
VVSFSAKNYRCRLYIVSVDAKTKQSLFSHATLIFFAALPPGKVIFMTVLGRMPQSLRNTNHTSIFSFREKRRIPFRFGVSVDIRFSLLWFYGRQSRKTFRGAHCKPTGALIIRKRIDLDFVERKKRECWKISYFFCPFWIHDEEFVDKWSHIFQKESNRTTFFICFLCDLLNRNQSLS